MTTEHKPHSEPLASGSVATDSGSTGGGAYSEPLADATYFGDGHAFTVAGDPEQLDKMAAYISELKCERAGLIEQLQASLHEGYSAEHWHREYDEACKSLSRRVKQGAEAVRRERSLREQLEAVLGAVQSARTIAIHNAERHTGFVHIGRILADIEDTLSNPASEPDA